MDTEEKLVLMTVLSPLLFYLRALHFIPHGDILSNLSKEGIVWTENKITK